MKRRVSALALAAVALAASACGSGQPAAKGSSADAARVLRESAAAARLAKSVGFRLSATVELPKGVGPAMLHGPVTFSAHGHLARLGHGPGRARFDLSFAVGISGVELAGEARSADGRTVYVRIPAVLPRGWYRADLPAGEAARTAPRPELGHLVRNVTLTSDGDTDTVSGDLDVRALVRAVLSLGHAPVAPRLDLDRVAQAVEVAHGSLSVDRSSHLPGAFDGHLVVRPPRGDGTLELVVHAAYDDWNAPFAVTVPAHAKPLSHAGGAAGLGLFGGASPLI